MALEDNLLAFYKLSDATDAFDSINLTETGGPVYTAGKIGNALDVGTYQGSGSGSRLLSSNAAFDFNDGNRTIAGWVYFNSTASSPGLASNWANGGATQWLLWHDGTAVAFRTRSLLSIDTDIQWGSAPSTGTWYFFTITWNKTTGGMSLSVNNGTPLTAVAVSIATGTTAFELGARNNGLAVLNGALDAVGIWSRVLSASEITQLYNSGSGREYPFAVASTDLNPSLFDDGTC